MMVNGLFFASTRLAIVIVVIPVRLDVVSVNSIALATVLILRFELVDGFHARLIIANLALLFLWSLLLEGLVDVCPHVSASSFFLMMGKLFLIF